MGQAKSARTPYARFGTASTIIPAMEPQIQYATTLDGVCIAYTVMGEGPPLVYASNAIGDVHWYAHNEATRAQVDGLVASGWRVVRYDSRGMGSSDRDVTDLSLEARLLDLEAVVDELKLERFALCGYLHGAGPAIHYAIRRPERVSHLLLVNPYPDGGAHYDAIPAARAISGLVGMAEEQWEFFTLMMASAMGGFTDPVQARKTAELVKQGISPAAYAAFIEGVRKIDLTSALPQVSVPTLVVVDPAGIGSADASRAVAARIRGARLVATDDYTREITLFMGGTPVEAAPRAQPQQAGSTASILFTDIAGSTALTERLGDAAFRDRARALDAELRRIIADSGGAAIEGKLLGDGVLATFPSAAQAVEAALACCAQGESSGLSLHVGLHAGDVIREGDNVYGGAVNIAARVCSLSAPNEILATDIIRGLARTSSAAAFDDRGEHLLKGIEDPVRVYAVREG